MKVVDAPIPRDLLDPLKALAKRWETEGYDAEQYARELRAVIARLQVKE